MTHHYPLRGGLLCFVDTVDPDRSLTIRCREGQLTYSQDGENHTVELSAVVSSSTPVTIETYDFFAHESVSSRLYKLIVSCPAGSLQLDRVYRSSIQLIESDTIRYRVGHIQFEGKLLSDSEDTK